MSLTAEQIEIMERLEAPLFAIALRIEHPSGTDLLWSGVGPLAATADDDIEPGAIFDGSGILRELPQIKSARNGDSERVEFVFSGVDTLPKSWMTPSNDVSDAIVRMGMIWFDPEWQMRMRIGWLWTGGGVTVRSAGSGTERTITLSAISGAVGRARAEMSYWTDKQHRVDHPTDTFFKRVITFNNAYIKKWPG